MTDSYEMAGTKSDSIMNDKHGTSKFRRYLPQIIASTVKNFLLVDLGMSIVFPSIVIPALTGIFNDFNQNEMLSMTPVQASWFASMALIFQPIGSIFSSFITDPLGRKQAMFIVNFPHVIAWLMMYNATSIRDIFIANILLGFGVGLMEAPILTYVGEISEPSIRGILTAFSGISASFGFSIVYLLNTLMAWRSVGLVCLSIPLITMFAVCFIPETPLWLLSKNRSAEAQKSLQWLRGWVSKEAISDEFKALQRYSERSKSCISCIKVNRTCNHPEPNFMEKIKELKRKQTLKPFFIVFCGFLLARFTGVAAMRPYIVQILKAYRTPLDPDHAALLLSLTTNTATIILIAFVRFLGKRRIYLFVLMGSLLSSFMLSIYGFLYLPSGYTSFDHPYSPFHTIKFESIGIIPLILITSWIFFTSAGVSALPWMLLSEVFPFKSRSMATGLSAALDYILGFVATKSYYDLEISLSMPGVTLFYSIISVFGWILMFKILPETENRTLEDIELHFSDNSKDLTNRTIIKVPKIKKMHDIEAVNGTLIINSTFKSDIDFKNKNDATKSGCDSKFNMDFENL